MHNSRSSVAAHRGARRRRPLIAVSVALAIVGGVAAVAGGVTSAAYTDQANLNLAGDAGVGYAGRFDIGVVLPNGTVEQADSPDGYAWAVPGAATLVPGHELVTQIPVFNNTADLLARTTMTVIARNGDGAVSATVPNITPFLRFTAVTGSGTVLFSDATLADAHASLGDLAARAQTPLAQGDAYAAGASGSSATITLTIRYLDASGVEALNGGQSAVAVRFDAVSAKP